MTNRATDILEQIQIKQNILLEETKTDKFISDPKNVLQNLLDELDQILEQYDCEEL
jgi:hypothetical protein